MKKYFFLISCLLSVHSAQASDFVLRPKYKPQETVNAVLQTMDGTLSRGNKLKDWPRLRSGSEELMLQEFPDINEQDRQAILKKTSLWMKKYPSAFPTVGLLHRLAGGALEDIRDARAQSTDYLFRRYCTLTMCLDGTAMTPEKSQTEKYSKSPINAHLAVKEEEGGGICLELTLNKNNTYNLTHGYKFAVPVFSYYNLEPNIQIRRKDGVPVLYSKASMLFMTSDMLYSTPEDRDYYYGNARACGYDMSVIQPSSSIVRREVLQLLKRERTLDTGDLVSAYLKAKGAYYTLCDHIVVGEINAPLEIELRYVYDSSLFDGCLGKYSAELPFYRIESNPVYLIIGENGELKVKKKGEVP